jgi:hypothetical protein
MSEEFVIPKDYKPKGRLTKKIWGSFLKSVPELLKPVFFKNHAYKNLSFKKKALAKKQD